MAAVYPTNESRWIVWSENIRRLQSLVFFIHLLVLGSHFYLSCCGLGTCWCCDMLPPFQFPFKSHCVTQYPGKWHPPFWLFLPLLCERYQIAAGQPTCLGYLSLSKHPYVLSPFLDERKPDCLVTLHRIGKGTKDCGKATSRTQQVPTVFPCLVQNQIGCSFSDYPNLPLPVFVSAGVPVCTCSDICTSVSKGFSTLNFCWRPKISLIPLVQFKL